MVARAIYDTLTRPNADGEYEPWLAESVEPNDDFTEWTITLRDGVKFHDGTDLDRRGREEQPRRLPRRLPRPDPAAVHLHVRQHRQRRRGRPADRRGRPRSSRGRRSTPTSTAAAGSASWPRPSSTTPRPAPTTSIGTGPFMLDEWVPNQSLAATKNPDYWADRRRRRASCPTSTRSSSGRSSRWRSGVNALESGDINAMHTSDAADDRPTCVARPSRASSTPTESSEFGEVSYVMLNESKPPFDNIKARQALAYAVQLRGATTPSATRASSPGPPGPFAPGNIGNLDDTGFPDLRPRRGRAPGRRVRGRRPASSCAFTLHDHPARVDDRRGPAHPGAGRGGRHRAWRSCTVDQSTQIDAAIAGDFQAIGWRNHPGGDPDEQYIWWQSALARSTSAGSTTPRSTACSTRAAPTPTTSARAGIYEDLNRRFAEQVHNVWSWYTLWTVGDGDRRARGAGRGPDERRPVPRPGRRASRRRTCGSSSSGRYVTCRVLLPPVRPSGGRAVLRHAVRGAADQPAPGRPGRTPSPGSPARSRRRQLREQLGLDDPVPVQYGRWLGDFVTGDLGSYYSRHRRPAGRWTGSRDALPVSLQLMVYAQVLALVVAIPLGRGHRLPGRDRRFDRAANATAFGLLAIPNFALALVLAYYVGVRAGVVARERLRRAERGPRRAPPAHGAARHRPRGRPDRRLHAPAAQRHDRHAAGGLHHDGQGQGPVAPARPVAPRAAAVEPHAAHRGRASTSARSSAARSWSR